MKSQNWFLIFFTLYTITPWSSYTNSFEKKNSPSYRLFIFGAPLCIICRIMQRRLRAAYFSSHTENHEQFCLLITLYKTENILARKLWYKYVNHKLCFERKTSSLSFFDDVINLWGLGPIVFWSLTHLSTFVPSFTLVSQFVQFWW